MRVVFAKLRGELIRPNLVGCLGSELFRPG